MIRIPDQEIARYLGYHGFSPDETVQEQIEEVKAGLLSSCHPRMITKEEPLEFHGSETVLGPIRTTSRDVYRNLQGCERVLLLGATLGAEADYLIRRYEKLDMAKAAVAQAVSAAFIEAYLDEEQAKITEKYAKDGWYLRPRYSPGYGDFPLSLQPEFIAVLEMNRFLGVTLTDGLLMVPSKSVTAIIGLSRSGASVTSSCRNCSKPSCPYRKEF